MSSDNHCPPYRHKFKGIENFLRRVAFNLGNTPSQTEVKIISCIPIDVTDLQQKINTLERELYEVRAGTNKNDNIKANAKNTPNPTRQTTPIVQTALGKPIPMFCKSKSKTQCKYSQAKTSVTSQGCNTKLNKPRKCRFKRKRSSVCNVSSFSSEDKADGQYNMAYKIDPNFSRTKVPVAKGCYKKRNSDNASAHAENVTAEQNESKDGDVPPNIVTNESDSDDTLVADEATQRKEKPGLLQKVLRSVKKFKRYKPKRQKRSAKGDIDSEESGTESQTVYSYKTYRDLNPGPKNNTAKPKSTVQADTQVDKSFQENVRRLSPYMEQEYRRYWEEKLMFHEGKSPLHSSEKSHAWTRSPQSPMYWRGYEARSAILKDGELKLPRGYRRGDGTTQKERTGLKLEWMKKQKFKSIKEHQ
ncbi:unnamed protein product, partial [Iphiclides podalirius]